MDSRKRRSSLRKPVAFDVGATDVKTQFKRRISFSGKHLVREFHGEEEPKTWNNSYEISDHLNVDESTLNFFPSTKLKKVKSLENKENVKSANSQARDELKSCTLTKNQRDISSTNNTSVFSSSKDMINVSYQNSKLYQIENSVDITLHDRELKFRIERDKDERNATNICSFSLDDNEKGGHSAVFCERTVDFMRDLERNNPNVGGYDENIILQDVKKTEVSSCTDYMNESSFMDFTCTRFDNAKEVVTIHANDSLIISPKTKCSAGDQKMNNKRETTRQSIVMQISPHKAMQYDKENINPSAIPNVNDTILNTNGTINNICEMEVEDAQFFHQPNVNVEKESREFGNKLNCISFLQDPESDACIKEGTNGQKPIINANVKYRSTINFNQPIEMSPKDYDFNKDKIKSRTSIHISTQSMNLSQEKIVAHEDMSSDNLKSNQINVLYDNEYENNEAIVNPLQNRKSRHTDNYNRPIIVEDLHYENKNDAISKQEVSSADNLKSSKTIVYNDSIVESSPINAYKNCEGFIDVKRNTKPRHTVNFNQTIVAEDLSQENKRGAIPKTIICLPSNNNQSIEIDTRADFPRQTIKCYEDIHLSPQKSSKECVIGNKLITSESSLNNVQQPKLVIRKIYTPMINRNTNPINVEQHKLMRYKMKQKENSIHNISMNEEADVVETSLVKEKSLNFSMSSVRNMSLSPDSSSFLIPSEFKGYNLKQLNDEIENGKLHVFTNAIKTPGSNRKLRTPSHFGLENIQSFQTYTKHRRTLVFQNEDILVTSNDSLNKAILNEESKEKKNNAVCRYSQADDIMLDNTSFLAKAKLSDETVSRNLDISNESLEEAAIESNVALKKNTGNQATCSMFRNDKPIFIQTKDSNINQKNTSTYIKSYKNNSMDKSEQEYNNLIQNKIENNDNKMVSDDLNCQNILDSLEESLKNPRKATYDNCNTNDEKMVTVDGHDSSANVGMIQDRNRGINANISEKLKGNKSIKSFVNNYSEIESLLDICESNFIELSGSDVKEKKIRRRENEQNENEQKIGGRKSIYVEENMNLTLDNIETVKEGDKNKTKCEEDYIETEQISSQGANIQHLKNTIQTRDSIYTTECMDFTLNEFRQKGHLSKLEKQLKSEKNSCIQSGRVKNCEIDLITNDPTAEENINAVVCDNSNLSNASNEISFTDNKGKRKSMLFKENNDMSIDHSISQVDCVQFPEPIMQSNAAKISLERNFTTTSMASKLQGILNKQNNSLVTPVKTGAFNQLCYITPRLSLIEFTAAEKRAKKEEILHNLRRFSPTLSETSNKRMPINLTPLLSISKKRQTLIFDDCLMDESLDNGGVDVINEQKEQNQETLSLSVHEVKGPVMEISGICSNESLLQTPPKQRHSQIPIPVSSEKKSQSNRSSDNFKESEKESDLEGDNLAESIQLMRRTKSSKQISDQSIECAKNIAIQASVFEGNPITISDVSIFFEAQRKSQSLAPQIKEGVTAEEHNMNGINAIEAAKNGLENRYINLTLDDIDKTRLSLVRASYEGEDDNQSFSKYFVINDQNPMNLMDTRQDVEKKSSFDSKRRSVCRKCKRCEETLLNESTSSTSDTFVLPELPPLPDLELDLLKRLRKRPTISDVNVLWQRLSLDGKIMNTINISDNSVVIADMEDEKLPISKCEMVIEKYRFKRECLNNRLSEKCFTKPPFVERLNNLLRTPLSNWIFDFQKQYRGILSFTHRHLLTYSVLLTFEELDALGCDIKLKDVKLEKGHMPETYWKPIDFVLNFQFKLNLPLDLKSLCESNSEAGILKMLQTIDRFCVDTVKMGICLQRICFTNQASILRDEHRTYVCKTVKKIINRNDAPFIDKTVIKIELLNLKKLSFKDICSPKLHNFREEIHLLPVGLEFLRAFLPNPLNYLKNP